MKSMPDPPPDLTRWHLPKEHPSLEPDAVHVWILPLEVAGSRLGELGQLLDPEERERAARFKLPGLGRRFTVSRAGLRILLSRYLGTEPERLTFRYGSRGKPFLSPWRGQDHPQFNLAHSSELALVAVASGRIVGIDLERKQWKDSLQDIAKRYFSPTECELLQREVSREAKADRFFALWSMKEAILKATGEGIADLTKVEVQPELRALSDEFDLMRWRLHEVTPIAGFSAALAVEGEGARVSCWRWEW